MIFHIHTADSLFHRILSIPRRILRWTAWKYQAHKERKERYSARLAGSLSDMRYLKHIVILPDCLYRIGRRKFSTLSKALEYARRIPIEKLARQLDGVKNGGGKTIRIFIENPHAPEIFLNEWIPAGLLYKDTKDPLCVYARERILTFAADLSEVYTEYFELGDSIHSYSEHIYDYGVLYGHYPIYSGTELCVSSITEDWNDGNIPFVPEKRRYGLETPCMIYDRLHEVYMAYDCYLIDRSSDGSVYDDGNGRFPVDALPVSTFVNIGTAGVYLDCWKTIWDNRDDLYARYSYAAEDSEHYELFRFALMECKERELPEDRAYYTIHIKDCEADGVFPADYVPCTYEESRRQLFIHAKHRTLYLSPNFDAVYWEEFTLNDADNRILHFCYDYALLMYSSPELAVGMYCYTN